MDTVITVSINTFEPTFSVGSITFIGPVCYTRVADGKINDYE